MLFNSSSLLHRWLCFVQFLPLVLSVVGVAEPLLELIWKSLITSFACWFHVHLIEFSLMVEFSVTERAREAANAPALV